MKVKAILDVVGKAIVKNSPTILTAVGITGMVAAAVIACRETPKAIQMMEKKEKPFDKAVEGAKVYWPAALVGVTSAGCLIAANSINLKRQLAALAVASLSEGRLKEYQDAVKRTLGEKKEDEIKGEVAKSALAHTDGSEHQTVIFTGNGDSLCFDAVSGRYFKSNIEKVRQAVNRVNKSMLDTGGACLNDFYEELDLPPIKLGDMLGWSYENKGDLLEVSFSSQLDPDHVPCLVLDYSIAPTYWNEY